MKEKIREKMVRAISAFLTTLYDDEVSPSHLQALMYALEIMGGIKVKRVDLPTGKVWIAEEDIPILYWDGRSWFLARNPWGGWEEFIPVEV